MRQKSDGIIKFVLSLDSNGAVKGIEELEKKGTSLSKKISTVGKTMTIGLTMPLTALATAGIKYNASMETYAANLTTLLNGNQEAASQLLSDLKSMANTTPFETTSLVKATQTMLGFGIQLQDSQKYLKQLGDIAMGDANKLDGLTLAFAQVQSAGKLSGQDLLQMINQGFNPLNVISQKTGESMASLKERMGDGALSAQEVAQALQWATEEGGLFYGAMDKASQTTEGKLSTLKDEFNSAVGEMTTSLLPAFTETVDKLTEIARWFSNLSPKQKEFIVQIGKIVAITGPALIVFGKLIDVFDKTKKRIELVKKTMKALEVTTKAQTIATKAQVVATKLATGAMKLFNLVMNANPLFLIVTAIVAVVAGMALMYSKFEWFRNAVDGVFSFVVSIIQGVIDFFKNNWQTIILFILNPFAGIFKVLYDKFSGFRNFVNTIISSIKNVFLGLFNFIKTIGMKIYNFLKNVFILIVAVVAMTLEGIYNIIKWVVNGAIAIVSTIANWVYTNVLLPIFNFFLTIFTAIYNTIVSFISLVFSIFGTIANWIYINVLQPIFNFFSSVFSTIWNGIVFGIDFIKNVFMSFLNFIYTNILLPIFNFFSSIWNGILGVISFVIDNIKVGFSNVVGFVKTAFNNVKSFITKIFSAVGNIIKTPINGVIDLINGVLKGLNKIKVPDWVPGMGGMKVNFSMIPKLSTGTNNVAREGLAYLHQGEAVVPKKYNPAIGGYGNSGQIVYVTVNADMDVNKFGKAFVRDIKTFSGGAKNSYNYGGGQ